MRVSVPLLLTTAMLLAGCGDSGAASASPQPVTLVQFAAGTLAVPFKQVNAAFSAAHPGASFQPQFGGSVKMVKQVTDLGQRADVVAVADYSVIPQQMLGAGGKKAYASWYAGFASNAITFVYTAKSKGADRITAGNWYKVLAEPGVQIGRSNPDTDPSGYQTLQMLQLAQRYYHQPGLSAAVLENAPASNMRDTETELLSALEAGQIDYLAIYRSDAQQHHLNYLKLPPQIDLSDASYAAGYASAVVHTKNGELPGKPIIYAVTVPDNAPHPGQAQQFVAFLLGSGGAQVMQQNGFVPIAPALASDSTKLPATLRALTRPWPAQPGAHASPAA